MRFKCSDTKCPAKGIYYEYLETFIPKEGDQNKHIEYESHSYIAPEIYKKKVDNNEFEENDFISDGEIKKEIIGIYMKLIFLKDYKIIPTDAKIIFNKKFPNINLNDKSLDIIKFL